MNKYDIRNYLLEIDPKLKLAYTLTAKYRKFNKTSNYENAKTEFCEIVNLFRDSNLKPFIDCANTLVNWGPYIINSFITLSYGRRLSNGPCEGINATIEKINLNGNGYWNFFSFKNRCAYVINKDVPISFHK